MRRVTATMRRCIGWVRGLARRGLRTVCGRRRAVSLIAIVVVDLLGWTLIAELVRRSQRLFAR